MGSRGLLHTDCPGLPPPPGAPQQTESLPPAVIQPCPQEWPPFLQVRPVLSLLMPRTGLDDRAMVGEWAPEGHACWALRGPGGGAAVFRHHGHIPGAGLRGHLAAGTAPCDGAPWDGTGLLEAGLPPHPTGPQPREAGGDGRWTPASLSALASLCPPPAAPQDKSDLAPHPRPGGGSR